MFTKPSNCENTYYTIDYVVLEYHLFIKLRINGFFVQIDV